MLTLLALQMPLGLSWGQFPEQIQLPSQTVKTVYHSTVQYGYTASIQEYPVTVLLNFTPKSLKLWRVDFILNATKKPDPYLLIWTMLTNQYGFPEDALSLERNKIFWKIADGEDVTSIYYGYGLTNRLSLSYQSKSFNQLREREL